MEKSPAEIVKEKLEKLKNKAKDEPVNEDCYSAVPEVVSLRDAYTSVKLMLYRYDELEDKYIQYGIPELKIIENGITSLEILKSSNIDISWFKARKNWNADLLTQYKSYTEHVSKLEDLTSIQLEEFEVLMKEFEA